MRGLWPAVMMLAGGVLIVIAWPVRVPLDDKTGLPPGPDDPVLPPPLKTRR